ncbi:MAG TPA: hypothetical protein VFO46_08810 [Candidatus Sulfotelmatobacter sp.]|nr:hypothetical protein [Candidatus Sulfotelmatobacter sp.]
MKSRKGILIAAAISTFALAIPIHVVAQHIRYKLIDLGTLGGPNSGVPGVFFEIDNAPGAAQVISEQGIVTGTADTPTPDPLCFFDDCFYSNTFQWQNGKLTSLGALPGAQLSGPSWISGNGLIAGISENGKTDPLLGVPEGRAVLWRKSQITDLGTLPGGYESFAWGVNNRGQVVGNATNGTVDPYSYYYSTIFGISNGTQTRAFVWDKHSGMQDLGTLGGPDAWAAFVNEQGQIAGISFTSFTPNADNGPSCAPNVPNQDPFFWEKDSGMIDIGTFGGTCGAPQAFNQRGQVVGGSFLTGNSAVHPFLWDRSKQPPLRDLGTFGGDNGTANWISDSGLIVGWADFPGDQIHHAALWSDGVMTDLGTVGTDPCSRALAINSKGQVVGGSSDCNTFLHAYIWEDGGPMIDLNTFVPPSSDLTLTLATFINEHGVIAGNGVLSNGDTHAFVLIPCGEGDDACNNAANSTGPTQRNTGTAVPSLKSTKQGGVRSDRFNMARW